MAKKSTTKKTTKATTAARSKRAAKTVVTVEDTSKTKTTANNNPEFFDKIRTDLNKNKSFMNLALGAVILLIAGLLLFNYFSKNNSGQKDLGPSQQTDTQSQQSGDVAKDKLPGKYTIKQGDTLFTIAQNYYGDGYKYPEIVKANNMTNENAIEVGQVIEIPKVEGTEPSSSPSESPSVSPSASASPSVSASPSQTPEGQTMNQQNPDNGQGGAENQTMWGEKITGNTYTVQAGDWLSKIAGRAYGDVMTYEKLAQANNITDPNNIEVGTVLKIPR